MTSTPKSTRLRITIDDILLAEAMQVTGASSTREVIAQSLQLLVQVKRQEQLRDARGFRRGIDTSSIAAELQRRTMDRVTTRVGRRAVLG